jgi:hypothetical protein
MLWGVLRFKLTEASTCLNLSLLATRMEVDHAFWGVSGRNRGRKLLERAVACNLVKPRGACPCPRPFDSLGVPVSVI